VNGHVLPGERLAHDTLDELVRVLVRFKSVVGSSPWLLKVSPLPPSRHRRCIAWVAPLGQADIKSAFKHIPVCPSQRWACGVAFKAKGTTFVCRHVSCPFGAVGSVHGWERVGAGIAFIARKYLKIATLRYVDDFFGPERSAHGPCARLESKLCTAVPPPLCLSREATVESALQCLGRLVRLLLGDGALATDKLEWGQSLCILGLDVVPGVLGLACRPSLEKARATLHSWGVRSYLPRVASCAGGTLDQRNRTRPRCWEAGPWGSK